MSTLSWVRESRGEHTEAGQPPAAGIDPALRRWIPLVPLLGVLLVATAALVWVLAL
jgi:hypothetical protein